MMKVIKIGGGSLKDRETIEHIFDLIATQGQGNIFVLSALNGVTDALIDASL
jgi:aspartate kinase